MLNSACFAYWQSVIPNPAEQFVFWPLAERNLIFPRFFLYTYYERHNSLREFASTLVAEEWHKRGRSLKNVA